MNTERFTILCGDCIDIMSSMDDNVFDSIVTDPPYGLSLMNKSWDHGVPGIPFWSEMLRVAKPGSFLMAFGGGRTHHRLMCAIEDSGWELRDSIHWLYSSGYPKSLNIGKAVDREVGAVREKKVYRITPGTTAAKGFSNQIDERPWMTEAREKGYHVADGDTPASEHGEMWDGWHTGLKPAAEIIVVAMKPKDGTFAQNALKWGVSGLWTNGTKIADRDGGDPRWPANAILDEEVAAYLDREFGDVSRYFYCSKASTPEKSAGLPDGVVNDHPTVKPVDLMEYLCRLTKTPGGGVVLDPFSGSGSTGVGAIIAGRNFVGIDIDQHYCDISRFRIERAARMHGSS